MAAAEFHDQKTKRGECKFIRRVHQSYLYLPTVIDEVKKSSSATLKEAKKKQLRWKASN